VRSRTGVRRRGFALPCCFPHGCRAPWRSRVLGAPPCVRRTRDTTACRHAAGRVDRGLACCPGDGTDHERNGTGECRGVRCPCRRDRTGLRGAGDGGSCRLRGPEPAGQCRHDTSKRVDRPREGRDTENSARGRRKQLSEREHSRERAGSNRGSRQTGNLGRRHRCRGAGGRLRERRHRDRAGRQWARRIG
jgi:hypothetical protein